MARVTDKTSLQPPVTPSAWAMVRETIRELCRRAITGIPGTPGNLAKFGPGGDLIDTGILAPGAWTAWNPSVTNLAKGDAVIKAAYRQIGKSVRVRYLLKWGSTTSASGTLVFPFPVEPHADYLSQYASLGTAFLRDDSTTDRLNGAINTGASGFAIYANNSITNAGGVSNTIPWSWAVNDTLAFEFEYESA